MRNCPTILVFCSESENSLALVRMDEQPKFRHCVYAIPRHDNFPTHAVSVLRSQWSSEKYQQDSRSWVQIHYRLWWQGLSGVTPKYQVSFWFTQTMFHIEQKHSKKCQQDRRTTFHRVPLFHGDGLCPEERPIIVQFEPRLPNNYALHAPSRRSSARTITRMLAAPLCKDSE